MRRFTTIEEQQEIIKLYQEGKTLSFIGKLKHAKPATIKKVLINNNIPIKNKGTKTNRCLKENYFESIDSEEKAYFLGLLFADGSVVLDKSEKRSPMISLSLKLSDYDIIEQFKVAIGHDRSFSYDKRKSREMVGISFRNKKVAQDLKKYGIVPNKTYETNHLPSNIPQIFEKDFLRGLIDGDGSFYYSGKKWHCSLTSYHYSICKEFQDRINSFLTDKCTTKVAKYGTAYHCVINKKEQLRQLVTALYKDSKVFLARKYRLAMAILEDKTGEDIVYSVQSPEKNTSKEAV